MDVDDKEDDDGNKDIGGGEMDGDKGEDGDFDVVVVAVVAIAVVVIIDIFVIVKANEIVSFSRKCPLSFFT